MKFFQSWVSLKLDKVIFLILFSSGISYAAHIPGSVTAANLFSTTIKERKCVVSPRVEAFTSFGEGITFALREVVGHKVVVKENLKVDTEGNNVYTASWSYEDGTYTALVTKAGEFEYISTLCKVAGLENPLRQSFPLQGVG